MSLLVFSYNEGEYDFYARVTQAININNTLAHIL